LIRRRKYPRVNELVIGTVSEIFEHGAFVTLDEYDGLEAYCPLNEVSRSWFKGIREVLKEGQKRVFKVIRVDSRKGHVDISLKRVDKSERKAKIKEWKRYQRAVKLIELIAKKTGKSLDYVCRNLAWKLEDYYGEIYAGFENAARYGEKAFQGLNIPEDLAKVAVEVAQAYIELPTAKVSGIIILRSLKPDGIIAIKNVLLDGEKVAKQFEEVKTRIYTEGAPRYKIDLEGPDYKIVEKVLSVMLKTMEERAKQYGCSFSFKRIKT